MKSYLVLMTKTGSARVMIRLRMWRVLPTIRDIQPRRSNLSSHIAVMIGTLESRQGKKLIHDKPNLVDEVNYITFFTVTKKILNSIVFLTADATPIVIWHGLGQSCCDPMAIGRVKSVVANTTRAYVVSIKVLLSNFFATDIFHVYNFIIYYFNWYMITLIKNYDLHICSIFLMIVLLITKFPA